MKKYVYYNGKSDIVNNNTKMYKLVKHLKKMQDTVYIYSQECIASGNTFNNFMKSIESYFYEALRYSPLDDNGKQHISHLNRCLKVNYSIVLGDEEIFDMEQSTYQWAKRRLTIMVREEDLSCNIVWYLNGKHLKIRPKNVVFSSL